jgi:cytochrome c biogenesis protein CcmG/thiol:disulfide interchange protein DsbE
LVIALVSTALACTNRADATDDPLGAKRMSTPAPALAGDDLYGEPVSLADLRGQVVVVNFWATWCDPCRDEQPALERVRREYQDQGVEFLGVDERDDLAAAQAWVEEFDVTYPSVQDPSGSWADDFELFGYPDTFVIDPSGTIRWAVYGQTSEEQLRELIDLVLAE